MSPVDAALAAPGSWVELAVTGRGSVRLRIPNRFDVIGGLVQEHGEYCPPHYELALGLIPRCGTVLDLGAHLGTFALAAAARGYRVIAVEASPRNAACLRASVSANGFEGLLTVIEAAVSDRRGTVTFHDDGAWGRITADTTPGDLAVPAMTVGQLLDQVGVQHVDLVKIDVEGGEFAIIDGMLDMLSADDAPTIVYENNAWTFTLNGLDQTPQALIARFVSLGFRNHLVWPPRQLIPVGADTFQPETCVDYVAQKGDRPLPDGWAVREARSQDELASVIANEARVPNPFQREQIAHSLRHASPALLSRQDIQATLDALTMDPVDPVAGAVRWWNPAAATVHGAATEPVQATAIGVLARQQRAVADRVACIGARWQARQPLRPGRGTTTEQESDHVPSR